MKTSLLFTAILILSALLSGCSSSGSGKAAPDELFFVTNQTYDSSDHILKGYMDKTGKIVIGPWYELEFKGEKQKLFTSMPFFEGMAGICFTDSNPDPKASKSYMDACGFIDKTGKIVIEPAYRKISYFSEGLAAVSSDGESWGYIDKSGKMVIEPKFYYSSPFSDGLASNSPFKTEGGRKDGYIDKTGKWAIETKYDLAGKFGDGYAAVKTEKGSTVIDKTGKEVTGCGDLLREYKMHPDTLKFLYGTYAYGDEYPIFQGGFGATRFGYTDKTCKLLIDDLSKTEKLGEGKQSGFRPMSENLGLGKVFYSDVAELGRLTGIDLDSEGWFFIDKDFKIMRKDSFADARPFVEGLAAVKSRDKKDDEPGAWGFIKPDMSVAIPFCFEKVGDFRGGLAEVTLSSTQDGPCARFNSKYYSIFINKEGNVVEPQWPKQEVK